MSQNRQILAYVAYVLKQQHLLWVSKLDPSHTSQLSPAQACTASADRSGTFRTHGQFDRQFCGSIGQVHENTIGICLSHTSYINYIFVTIYCRCNSIYIYINHNCKIKPDGKATVVLHNQCPFLPLDLSQDDVPKAGPPPAAGSSRKRPRTFSVRCGLDSGDVQRVAAWKFCRLDKAFQCLPENGRCYDMLHPSFGHVHGKNGVLNPWISGFSPQIPRYQTHSVPSGNLIFFRGKLPV